MSEIQTSTLDALMTGGHFHLTYRGQTTAEIAWNATTPQIKAALETLSIVMVDDITPEANHEPDTTLTCTWTFAATICDTPMLSMDITGATGPTSCDWAETVKGEGGELNAPCVGSIVRADNGIGKTIIRGSETPVDYSKRIITALQICHECEKCWRSPYPPSHENAHWEHCQTPHHIWVTFYNINKCDVACPDIPLNQKIEMRYGLSCDWWSADPIPGYPDFVAYYKVYAGSAPDFHTWLGLDGPPCPAGHNGHYFIAGTAGEPYMTFPEPCRPLTNGGQLNNACRCGSWPPDPFNNSGYGGHAIIEWPEPQIPK